MTLNFQWFTIGYASALLRVIEIPQNIYGIPIIFAKLMDIQYCQSLSNSFNNNNNNGYPYSLRLLSIINYYCYIILFVLLLAIITSVYPWHTKKKLFFFIMD